MEDAAVVKVFDSLEDLNQVAHYVVFGVTEPYRSKKKMHKQPLSLSSY